MVGDKATKENPLITGKLLHPEMLNALASAGHGAQIVIADSNYPFAIKSHPNTPKVYLNLTPGKLTVTDVLEVLVATVPIEAARAIDPEDGTEPAIFEEYRTSCRKISNWVSWAPSPSMKLPNRRIRRS